MRIAYDLENELIHCNASSRYFMIIFMCKLWSNVKGYWISPPPSIAPPLADRVASFARASSMRVGHGTPVVLFVELVCMADAA